MSAVAFWLLGEHRKVARGEDSQPAVNCSCPKPPLSLSEALPLAKARLKGDGEQYGEEALADRFSVTRPRGCGWRWRSPQKTPSPNGDAPHDWTTCWPCRTAIRPASRNWPRPMPRRCHATPHSSTRSTRPRRKPEAVHDGDGTEIPRLGGERRPVVPRAPADLGGRQVHRGQVPGRPPGFHASFHLLRARCRTQSWARSGRASAPSGWRRCRSAGGGVARAVVPPLEGRRGTATPQNGARCTASPARPARGAARCSALRRSRSSSCSCW